MPAPACAVASGSSRAGSWVVRSTVAEPASSREPAVEQLRSLGVERRERLVEHEQLGIVQQRAAEREPLHHPARVRGRRARRGRPRARTARAASRSARAAPARGRAGRRDRGSRARSGRGRGAARGRGSRARRGRRATSSSPPVGAASPATSRSSVVFPDPFAPRDDEEAAALELEVERPQRPPPPVALLDAPARDDHNERRRPATKPKKTMLITPLTVKKAASRRRRSPGRTSECS